MFFSLGRTETRADVCRCSGTSIRGLRSRILGYAEAVGLKCMGNWRFLSSWAWEHADAPHHVYTFFCLFQYRSKWRLLLFCFFHQARMKVKKSHVRQHTCLRSRLILLITTYFSTHTHTHTPSLTWHALILMILSESVAQVWLGCYRRFSQNLSIMLGPSMGCAQGEEPWVHWSLEMKPWTSMRWIKMGGTYRETPNLWNILHVVLAFYKTFNRESPRNTVVLCVCVCFEKGHWSHSSS